MKFGIQSQAVYTPRGRREGCVVIEGDKIVDVVDQAPAAIDVVDLGQVSLLPGLVDTHVHCNDPGRTDWETFPDATRAAAAGGITTIVDMPLNSSPVTTTVDAFKLKLSAARGKIFVDVGFHAGVVPGNEQKLGELLNAGVLGVKSFMVHSGIDEFPATGERELRRVMPLLAAYNVPLLVHAEIESCKAPAQTNVRSYAQYMNSRPRQWENDAVRLLIRLCREYHAPVHIVHLSSSDVLPDLAAAKAEGLPMTVETCPQYLFFAAEEIPDGATQFKCAPPIREKENREKLWAALVDGTIDSIASDHSPCEPVLKKLETGDFTKAWGGIASLQLGLSVIWTAADARGLPLENVVSWMATRPARMVALDGKKGAIAPGYDADFVAFDPKAAITVRGRKLWHKHKVTPYDGAELRGRVATTWLRGKKIYDGKGFAEASGEIVLRPVGGRGSEQEVE